MAKYKNIGILSERPIVDFEIKKEASDFIVEEIFDIEDLDGYDRKFDLDVLSKYFKDDEIANLQSFDIEKDQKIHFKTLNIASKEERTILHKELKKHPQIVTETKDGNLEVFKSNLKGIFSFILEKRNKDTVECVFELSQELAVDFNNIKFAGNKDRRAVTYQRVSISDIYFDQVSKYTGVRRERDHVRLGKFYGNKFTVLLRPVEGNNKKLEDAIEELQIRMNSENTSKESLDIPKNERSLGEKSKIPKTNDTNGQLKLKKDKFEEIPENNEKCLKISNFFGSQRFGRNSNNHIIGHLILTKKYQEAIDEIMKVKHTDTDYIKEAKILFQESQYDEAYKKFPKNCLTEKSICRNIRKGARTAIFSIKKTNRTFFLHSHQSYLFNLQLSEIIEKSEDREVLTLSGSKVTRNTFVFPQNLSITASSDGYALSFILPPSAYATIVIRELIGDFQ